MHKLVTLKHYLLQFTFFILLLAMYHFYIAKPIRVVTVDVQAVTQSMIQTLAETDDKSEAQSQKLATFAKTLDGLLVSLNADGRTIILPKQAVLEGAYDVTPWLQTQLEGAS